MTEVEYQSGLKSCCRKTGGSFGISSFVAVSTCEALTNGITFGPVSIAADATNWANYQSGIFDNCQTRLNDMFLLVGMSDT